MPCRPLPNHQPDCPRHLRKFRIHGPAQYDPAQPAPLRYAARSSWTTSFTAATPPSPSACSSILTSSPAQRTRRTGTTSTTPSTTSTSPSSAPRSSRGQQNAIPPRKSPERWGIYGGSTGDNRAFTAAWLRPDRLCRVRRVIGRLSGRAQMPDDSPYPDLISRVPRKPLRIVMQDGHHDLHRNEPRRNQPAENLRVAAALAEAGHDFRLAPADGAHSPNHGGILLPDAPRCPTGQLAEHRRQVGTRRRRPPPNRQALLVLAHLRCGDTCTRPAASFGTGVATVYQLLPSSATAHHTRATAEALLGAPTPGSAPARHARRRPAPRPTPACTTTPTTPSLMTTARLLRRRHPPRPPTSLPPPAIPTAPISPARPRPANSTHCAKPPSPALPPRRPGLPLHPLPAPPHPRRTARRRLLRPADRPRPHPPGAGEEPCPIRPAGTHDPSVDTDWPGDRR